MTGTTHIARSYTITVGALPEMIDELAPAVDPVWWLVSWATRTILRKAVPDESMHDSTEGRAFGPLGEIRWRSDEAAVHLVVVCPLDRTAFLRRTDLPDLSLARDPHRGSCDLWGEWNPDSRRWKEGRFPHSLNYALVGVETGDRVQISTQRFEDLADGPPLLAFMDAKVIREDTGTG